MRSVDVVFPASICAMIPMLRVSSSLNALPIVPEAAFFSPVRVATASLTTTTHSLPTIMRECLVRFLLAFPHHRADELLHNVAGIDRIRRLRSPENESFAWHCSLSLLQKSFHAQPLNQIVALLRRCGLRPLGAVLRPSLLAVLHARGI